MSAVAPLQNAAAKPQQSSPLGQGGLLLQRQCACGSPTSSLTGECEACKSKKGLQAKLTIGASNDPLEQEADRVADQVLAAPLNSVVSVVPPRIQRFTGQSTGQTDTAPASVDHVLASSGRQLEPTLQQEMEQRFGHDFSRVRVHLGAAAEQSARDVNAKAYTVGHNIVFGADQFAPGENEGRRLLAHELTHVLQQSGTAERVPHNALVCINQMSQKRIQRYGHDVQSCKEEDVVKILWSSDYLARQWLDEALADLNKDPLPAYVPPLLECYFSTKAADLTKIRKNLGIIKDRFQISDYFYVCKYDCKGSAETKTLGATKVSRWGGGSGPIILCMNNLKTQPVPEDIGAQTIIHEFAHRYLNFYNDTYCTGCCEGLSPNSALTNPDSYSGLVRDLHFKKLSIVRKEKMKKL